MCKHYFFSISYLNAGVIRTHDEFKKCANDSQAFEYFTDLLEQFEVGPYRYLCKWW